MTKVSPESEDCPEGEDRRGREGGREGEEIMAGASMNEWKCNAGKKWMFKPSF